MITEKLPDELRWISSLKSPLMILPRSLAREWHSSGPLRFQSILELCEPLALVEVGRGGALVLEDGFHTSWWPTVATGGGYLVRTLWSNDPNTVRAAIRTIPEDSWTPEDVEFDAREGVLELFPATESAVQPADCLTFFVTPGRFRIFSANVEPDSNTCLIVHRLMPVH